MYKSSNETTDSPDNIDLPASEPHSLLATDRRRLVLDSLAGQTSPVELEELAARIATREDESTPADEETIERVATTLHHTHLPKLAEAGVLDYDPESHRISPDEAPHSTRDRPIIPSADGRVAFADQHCRLALEYLAQHERATLEELTTEIASEDTDTVDTPAETIATQLHHNHLPCLDDAGFIHYNPDNRIVEATERITGQVADLLGDAQRD